MASPTLTHLPAEVLSQILSSFCDGKSISTFQIVARGCRSLRGSHVALVRDALVHRYVRLAEELRSCEEIGDVLDVVREDVRTCDPDGADVPKFAGWCAIVDYFEGTGGDDEWVVWSGPVGTGYGTLRARVTTPFWTAEALQFWYNELELVQFSLVAPVQDAPAVVDDVPYGRIEGVGRDDSSILRRVQYSMSPTFEGGRYALVPSHMEYDPALTFTLPVPYDRDRQDTQPALVCHWHGNDGGYDWEEAVERLGENVIRIMERCYNKDESDRVDDTDHD